MSTTLSFGWAYAFFSPKDIEVEYKAVVTFLEPSNIFRVVCSYEDAEYHIENFVLFVNAYIQKELGRQIKDLTVNGPVQVERLCLTEDNRSQYYNQATQKTSAPVPGGTILVGYEQFTELVLYRSTIVKERPVYKRLFELMARDNLCELRWLDTGIEITSEFKNSAQKLAELLLPLVHSLDGICVDLYSVDNPLHLKFQFRKPASPSDQGLYKTKKFPNGFVELHRVQWDSSSRQHITYRPTFTGQIICSVGTKNPWHKKRPVQFGTETNHPDLWQAILRPSATLSRFMLQNRAAEITNWAEQIGNDLIDVSTDQNSRAVLPSVLGKGGLEVSLSRTLRFGKEDEPTEGQSAKTDIQERQADYDFDRPRFRPAPLLKSGRSETSTASSSIGTTAMTALKFNEMVAEQVEILLSQFRGFECEETSLRVEFGQIYVSVPKAGSLYQAAVDGEQKVFPGDHWARVFPISNTDSEESCFANRITTCADSALYMAASVQGSKCLTDRTWYTITCQNKSTGAVGTITIDQGNVSIQATTDEISFINIHFPEFIWDARIKSSLTRPLSADDCQVFEELRDTIWIGQGSELLPDQEALYLRKPELVKIISCQRRRERVHRATKDEVGETAAVHLHTTRVEELQLLSSSPVHERYYIFSAEKQSVWFEAHLTSTSMARILPPATASLADIKEVITPLLDVTRRLVPQWNDVGSVDRVKAAQLRGSSVRT